MRVIFHGHQVLVPESLRVASEEKLNRLTKLSPRILKAEVTFSKDGDQYVAEVLLSLPGSPMVIGKDGAGDLLAAIELVVDHLERQLSRIKDKKKSRRPARRAVRTLLKKDQD